MHPACPGLKARRGVNLDSAPPRTSNPTRDGMFGPRLFWLFLIAGVGTTAFVMMMFMIEALKG
ncbi:hypothetical protein ACSQ76_12425 [Roseovarius sp. B08]|uniref:hypothetical protein n=1 Tax=Roseovarius sp. B08 TaxID=3449223 RepID=UPI003EDBE6F3